MGITALQRPFARPYCESYNQNQFAFPDRFAVPYLGTAAVLSAPELRRLVARLAGRLAFIASAGIALIAACSVAFAQTPVAPPPATGDQLSACDLIDVPHPEALADACRFALSLHRQLPNVICDQSTYRYIRPGPLQYGEKLQDRVTAHVIYEEGRERYSDLRINGSPLTTKVNDLKGQFTIGEYGTDLIFAFNPDNHPSYRFVRNDRVHSHHAFVFEAEVSPQNNHSWGVQANQRKTYPRFVARLWLDQKTHQILRVNVLPIAEKQFPISDMSIRTDYRDLSLGDGTTFVLPTKSESSSCLWDDPRNHIIFCSSNTLEFKNCHKFRARSRIVTDLDSTVK
jgi:hypothetical protein